MAIIKATELSSTKYLDLSARFPFMAKALYGIPLGRFIGFWGGPSTGKTTLALSLIGLLQEQKKGGLTVYVDAERMFDGRWAEIQGCKLDEMIVIRGSTAEEIFEDVRNVYAKHLDDIVGFVFDSAVAMSTEFEKRAKPQEQKVSELARLLSRELKVWAPAIGEKEILAIIINQIRDLIGGQVTRYTKAYMSYREPGPYLLKHLYHLKLFFHRISGKYKFDTVKITIVKTKTSSIIEGKNHILLVEPNIGLIDMWSDLAPASDFGIPMEGNSIKIDGKKYSIDRLLENGIYPLEIYQNKDNLKEFIESRLKK